MKGVCTVLGFGLLSLLTRVVYTCETFLVSPPGNATLDHYMMITRLVYVCGRFVLFARKHNTNCYMQWERLKGSWEKPDDTMCVSYLFKLNHKQAHLFGLIHLEDLLNIELQACWPKANSEKRYHNGRGGGQGMIDSCFTCIILCRVTTPTNWLQNFGTRIR